MSRTILGSGAGRVVDPQGGRALSPHGVRHKPIPRGRPLAVRGRDFARDRGTFGARCPPTRCPGLWLAGWRRRPGDAVVLIAAQLRRVSGETPWALLLLPPSLVRSGAL